MTSTNITFEEFKQLLGQNTVKDPRFINDNMLIIPQWNGKKLLVEAVYGRDNDPELAFYVLD
tara:strand:- start:838 stop:1023 length:186 start_codon:yes stop_codon:yes gene_type:complete